MIAFFRRECIIKQRLAIGHKRLRDYVFIYKPKVCIKLVTKNFLIYHIFREILILKCKRNKKPGVGRIYLVAVYVPV